jgi:peptide-methionine (S)-S-oxide reductase
MNKINFIIIIACTALVALHSTAYAQDDTHTAVFAGGCFWCTESDYEKVEGVISAESGYTGGHTANPTYKQVTRENTGHYEAVKVTYDPAIVSYEELVDYFWYTIDPTDPIGQFCDKGSSYRSAVFYANDEQKNIVEASLQSIQSTKPFEAEIVTEILPLQTFYSAENYHQDYYLKNPIKYSYYRSRCGRDKRIKSLWGEVQSKNLDK